MAQHYAALHRATPRCAMALPVVRIKSMIQWLKVAHIHHREGDSSGEGWEVRVGGMGSTDDDSDDA
jgi:hypothetical protein